MDDFVNAIKQSIYVSLKLIVGSSVNILSEYFDGTSKVDVGSGEEIKKGFRTN